MLPKRKEKRRILAYNHDNESLWNSLSNAVYFMLIGHSVLMIIIHTLHLCRCLKNKLMRNKQKSKSWLTSTETTTCFKLLQIFIPFLDRFLKIWIVNISKLIKNNKLKNLQHISPIQFCLFVCLFFVFLCLHFFSLLHSAQFRLPLPWRLT